MPHRIFLVEDLVVLVTKELIRPPYSEWDAVSFALTCRALENPALSVLWARRKTLSTLIRVLPPDTLAYTLRERFEEAGGNFSREELVRDSNFPSSYTSCSCIKFCTRKS